MRPWREVLLAFEDEKLVLVQGLLDDGEVGGGGGGVMVSTLAARSSAPKGIWEALVGWRLWTVMRDLIAHYDGVVWSCSLRVDGCRWLVVRMAVTAMDRCSEFVS